MKKVININFQGRVIPIEESAYDILKQYVESLRVFFAGEEGRDEIINDIEGRIAELFGEALKKGSTCITDDAVNTVIGSIGRPEDFDEEETKVQSQLGGEKKQQNQQTGSTEQTTQETRGGLFRNESDKIIGGVCSGLASYLRMDPSILRILFTIITIGGFGAGFLIYILMWIILPAKPLQSQVRKRLYRNPDDKVIAGVSSGIAAYFNIAVWIPRLIFAFPILLGILTSIFHNAFFHFDPFPSIIFGSFGSTLFIIYVVLWAVIPVANTATEKLEMRGEKIDLNSIKNTIQEDLGNFKTRAEKWGEEVKDKAEKFGTELKENIHQRSRSVASEATPIVRSTGSRLGHAIGILFKGFFLMIAGVIAFALLMAMIGLMLGGVSVLPLKDYFLNGFWQNFLAWGTIILFLGIPIIGLIIWLVRRIIGAKSHNAYLGYIFGGLWTLGWICVIFFIASVANEYKTKAGVEEKVSITQPRNNKLWVRVSPGALVNYYGSDWYGIHWDDGDAPFYGINEDSLMLRTIQVRVVKSEDSAFHLNMIKFSRGSNPESAKEAASQISFAVTQQDSILTLPRAFTITPEQKYRNQQILLVVEVPVGKKIELDKQVGEYKWINIDLNDDHNGGWGVDWNDNWENSYNWRTGEEYVMTDNGLKSTHPTEEEIQNEQDNPDDNAEDKKQQLQDIEQQKIELDKKQQDLEKSLQQDSTKYQYKPAAPQQPATEKTPGKTADLKTGDAGNEPEMITTPSSFMLMKINR